MLLLLYLGLLVLVLVLDAAAFAAMPMSTCMAAAMAGRPAHGAEGIDNRARAPRRLGPRRVAHRLQAAVVIVDISGFSKLSEYLIGVEANGDEGGGDGPSDRDRARSGTEKMQRILDSYFGKVRGTHPSGDDVTH